MKGNGYRSLSICTMATTSQLEIIKHFTNQLLADEPTCFLVNMVATPSNDIKIFIDADEGITIQKCIKTSRAINQYLIENTVFANDDFSLEVSSPGVGEPLLLNRQYQKNIGRAVEVITLDNHTIIGDLKAASETEITLQTTEGKGKKAIIKTTNILFSNIKSTIVQIKF